MVIGSEAVGHGIQIFDMTKLLDLSPENPKNFSTTTDLTGLFNELPVGRAHNVAVNEESDFFVAVGAQPRNDSCAAGLIYVDLSDPSNPTSPVSRIARKSVMAFHDHYVISHQPSST